MNIDLFLARLKNPWVDDVAWIGATNMRLRISSPDAGFLAAAAWEVGGVYGSTTTDFFYVCGWSTTIPTVSRLGNDLSKFLARVQKDLRLDLNTVSVSWDKNAGACWTWHGSHLVHAAVSRGEDGWWRNEISIVGAFGMIVIADPSFPPLSAEGNYVLISFLARWDTLFDFWRAKTGKLFEKYAL